MNDNLLDGWCLITGQALPEADECNAPPIDDEIFARDLDGTGSMHICSREDPGAVRYVRATTQ